MSDMVSDDIRERFNSYLQGIAIGTDFTSTLSRVAELAIGDVLRLEAKANAARGLMAALIALRGVHAGSSAYKPAVALRMTDAALAVAREAGVEP